MSEIRIGTASWTERTLLESGKFYPRQSMTAEERLKFYTEHFDTVEVDSTYYSPLAERNAMLWVQRTPPGFLFNIKAYSLLTGHPTPVKSLPKILQENLPADYKKIDRPKSYPLEIVEAAFDMFVSALRPLQAAHKLGCLLFQFPPWFTPSPESYAWLEMVKDKIPSACVAIEFRNGKWLQQDERQRVNDFLRQHKMSFVAVDAPWVQGWQGPVDLTTDIAYLRFHGRNRADWFKKGVTTEQKYKYSYNQKELGSWRDRIKSLSEHTSIIFTIFNNCYQDYALKNASVMKDLIAE